MFPAQSNPGQVTASGRAILVPSVNQPGHGVYTSAGGANALVRNTPRTSVMQHAEQRNGIRPPQAGETNVPWHSVRVNQGATAALLTPVGSDGTGVPGYEVGGMAGVDGLGKGLMARSNNVIGDAGFAADVSQLFDGATYMPRPTSLTMPNIVATSKAGLGAYTNITPTCLNQRMPSIIQDTPQDIAAMAAANCDPIGGFVNNNPMLAVGALVALAYLLFKD